MDKVLIPDKDYCRSYIDDVALFSKNMGDHLIYISAILQTLREVGLIVNLEKCERSKFLKVYNWVIKTCHGPRKGGSYEETSGT